MILVPAAANEPATPFGNDDRTLRALIFDVDGTLAETELDGHRLDADLVDLAQLCRWHRQTASDARCCRAERLPHN
ncbi:MAG TPA: hypothetical protein PK440_07115 [Candidatus Accumulibacter phosphatis]|nr:MAG: hypothetical protein AW07_00393 [Candidatus Accumulibacter sp. SK-11]HAY26075.1 hypothetical protein [Accumulibacter sp.]HRL74155.1 hypothetical protein [Candidatus Accumulibacter phosphatis]HCN69150.1 hypothetical protein [Accumulibacter sp.]HCV14158.1 hypothetical protein [Accumulibacter sp.]